MIRFNLSAWHGLFRTEHALITLVGVAVGQLSVADFYHTSIFAGVGPALITLAAFALNDYLGFETDKANKRSDRPIVAGTIKREHALYAALLLFLAGLFLTYLVNFTVFLISLAYVALSILYDLLLKKLPLVGNAIIALTMAGPFIYGNLAFTPMLSQKVVLLSVIAFLVGVGRELLNTLRDVKGDKKVGATTLPMLIGPRGTVFLSSFLILAAVFLSFVPLLSEPLPLLYAALLLPCDLLLLLTVYNALKSSDIVILAQCRNYTLAALGFGALAFLGLAIG